MRQIYLLFWSGLLLLNGERKARVVADHTSLSSETGAFGPQIHWFGWRHIFYKLQKTGRLCARFVLKLCLFFGLINTLLVACIVFLAVAYNAAWAVYRCCFDLTVYNIVIYLVYVLALLDLLTVPNDLYKTFRWISMSSGSWPLSAFFMDLNLLSIAFKVLDLFLLFRFYRECQWYDQAEHLGAQ